MIGRIWNNLWRFSPEQILEKCSARVFDLRYGTDTTTFVKLSDLDIRSSNKSLGERYQPSPVYSLRRVLNRLCIDFENFTFIDFGSGKGRTLLIAGEFPFKEVIGVEFGKELHDCAVQNISIYRGRTAGKIFSIHADATQFALPDGDLVLYFFNPFTEPVLQQVLNNIASSLASKPRKVIIVYLYLPNPSMFACLRHFRLHEIWRRYHIYKSVT